VSKVLKRRCSCVYCGRSLKGAISSSRDGQPVSSSLDRLLSQVQCAIHHQLWKHKGYRVLVRRVDTRCVRNGTRCETISMRNHSSMHVTACVRLIVFIALIIVTLPHFLPRYISCGKIKYSIFKRHGSFRAKSYYTRH